MGGQNPQSGFMVSGASSNGSRNFAEEAIFFMTIFYWSGGIAHLTPLVPIFHTPPPDPLLPSALFPPLISIKW